MHMLLLFQGSVSWIHGDGEDEDVCLIIGCQLSFFSASPLG
jgi:hypothetical protein